MTLTSSQVTSCSFNSLFKVLFYLPSQYFYSIDFGSLFIIRFNVQAFNDSLSRIMTLFNNAEILLQTGLSPYFTFFLKKHMCSKSTVTKTAVKLNYVILLFCSPLLKESYLFYISLLNNMLKFRRWSMYDQMQHKRIYLGITMNFVNVFLLA